MLVCSQTRYADHLLQLPSECRRVQVDSQGRTGAANRGATALFMAAKSGHAGTVQLLLSRGATVNQTKDGNVSPLLIAVWQGHVETIKVLLAAEASVDLPEGHGATPLYVLPTSSLYE